MIIMMVIMVILLLLQGTTGGPKKREFLTLRAFSWHLGFSLIIFFFQKIRNTFWFFLGYCRKPVKVADLLHYFMSHLNDGPIASYYSKLFISQEQNNFLKYCPAPVLCLAAQSCPTLWPHGLQPARLLCPWGSPGKSTGVGCHALLQGIFPTQGLNPGLPHCRWILYHLSHQGSPALGCH